MARAAIAEGLAQYWSVGGEQLGCFASLAFLGLLLDFFLFVAFFFLSLFFFFSIKLSLSQSMSFLTFDSLPCPTGGE